MTLETLIQLPPLESGDHLSRDEFERRYSTMPQVKKAELIEGVVYMGSPVRVIHSQPHAHMMGWLATYSAATPGVEFYDNLTVRLDEENEPQPDAVLRLEAGGQSWISDDGYLEGSPELVIEIAASSASYDLYEKLRVYQRNGVLEYIVWRTYSQKVDWFYLENSAYKILQPNSDSIMKSYNFPGLWLAVDLLLAGNLAEVLQSVQQGILSPEHQVLVTRLANAGQ
jgi:Uma2 family endonuclease